MSTGCVIYVIASDWEGVYHDGLLVDEGHRLDATVLREFQGLTITTYRCHSLDNDWMEEQGMLPQLYRDIPEYAKVF